MSKIYEFKASWPFIKAKEPAEIKQPETQPGFAPADLERVTLPDGRKGVIHHEKSDGKVGVRPIDANGRYLLNPNTNWKRADRVAIPEEYAFSREELK